MGLKRGRGRNARRFGWSGRSLWALRGEDWLRLARRFGRRLTDDTMISRSASLAYFFVLSIFPLLLFLTTLLGYLAHGALSDELFHYVSTLSPSSDVAALLRGTLVEITVARSGLRLWLSLAIALFIASQAVLAAGRVLNYAYGYDEGRPIWRRYLTALGLTLVLAVAVASVLALFFFGGRMAQGVAETLGAGAVFGVLWNVLQWLVFLLLAVGSFELIYNFAPAATADDRVWLTPGGVLGVGFWLLATSVLRAYIAFTSYPSRVYGSLGAVIALLIWFFFTGAAILIGGELNSEVVEAHHRVRGRRAEETSGRADDGSGPG